MRVKYFKICLLSLLILSIAESSSSQIPTNRVNSNSDSLAITTLINNFYKTLSFDEVEQNKYDSLTNFFIPEGLLISNVGNAPLVVTVQQYIEVAKENFKKQQISTWTENEICAKTELFSKVAHRFSTYKIKYVSNGKESFRTGINSFQLIKQNNRWLITTVAWDKEKQEIKIPPKYLCE